MACEFSVLMSTTSGMSLASARFLPTSDMLAQEETSPASSCAAQKKQNSVQDESLSSVSLEGSNASGGIFSETWKIEERYFDRFFDIACGLTNIDVLNGPLNVED